MRPIFSRSIRSISHLAAVVFLGCLASVATAQKKPAPAPKAAPKAPAAHPAGGGAAHGSTTASHGPTTGARTTTTTSRTTTSMGGHSMTTASHTTTTTNRGFGGRPSPAGGHEIHTANGGSIRTRPNGSRADVHDARRNMDIHHSLNGNRRVSVERADHSRVFAERGGRGYVQHPYAYHGREFGHRTVYDHGRVYDRYYHHYGYRGGYLDVYAPARYYPVGFYGWAYNPWRAPITYAWGWGAAPWIGFYGAYFTPYPVYPSAAFWLTDYLIANSLQAAYAVKAADDAAVASAGGAPVITPETKKMVSDEVQRQVALENSEAQANAQSQDIDPASSGIARMLSDNQPHVFVAGSDLDLVDTAGAECPISQGDILEVATPPPANADAATAVVLASKGGKECARSASVNVSFGDLQDMQNHMRETIDQGLGDLQTKQGKDGLPAAPPSAQGAPVTAAFAAAAPPPDPNAAAEINQQAQAADQAEQEVASTAGGPAAPAAAEAPAAPAAAVAPAPAAAPATISLGQTPDQVTAGMGAPTRIIDLGARKIYVYKDMKITFKDGKVSDVQ